VSDLKPGGVDIHKKDHSHCARLDDWCNKRQKETKSQGEITCKVGTEKYAQGALAQPALGKGRVNTNV